MTRAPRVYCRTTRSWKNCVTPESISRAAPWRNIAKPCAYRPQSSAGVKNWQPAPDTRSAYASCRIDVRNIFKVKSLGAGRPHCVWQESMEAYRCLYAYQDGTSALARPCNEK